MGGQQVVLHGLLPCPALVQSLGEHIHQRAAAGQFPALPALLFSEGQVFPAGGAGVLRVFRRAFHQCFILLRHRGQFCGDLAQACIVPGDLPVQCVRPGLLFRHFPPHPLDAVQSILQVGPEDGGTGLQFRCVALPVGQGGTQALQLQGLFLHPGVQCLPGGIQPLQLGVSGVQILFGPLIIVDDRRGPVVELVQIVQPHGHLQGFQLLPVGKALSGHLRLFFQGGDLKLQLRDAVVDPHQIFLSTVQLPLRFLFPVAVPGDAGGLFQNLPALLAAAGDDLSNAALADGGVPVPAQARVHEQLVHIPQADLLVVDIVFALPGPVVGPGQDHLAGVHVEKPAGVVKDQGHLGIPQLAPLLRSAEDHILHLLAPELFRALFAHDPADGIGDVGFPGAVGPHDGRYVVFK